jgi:hypothetical protein
MSDENRYRLIDTTHAVDVGRGYSLTWVVDVDGSTWPVLCDTRQREPQYFPHLAEDFRELAPHEMTGRLPADFQQFWCGARAHSGKPCRVRVAGPGLRCRHHPEVATPPDNGARKTGKRDRADAVQPALFDLDPGADS